MKNLLLLLLVILVFCTCAMVGYQAMTRIDQQPAESQPVVMNTVSADSHHYFVLIQVDSVAAPAPKIITVWFLSLFLTEGPPPTVTFNQIYPSQQNTARNEALEKAFLMTPDHEPSAAFWRELEVFEIRWEGYMMVDGQGFENIFSWLHDTAGLDQATRDGLLTAPDQLSRMQKGCQALSMQSGQPARSFDLQTLFPNHLQSNLRMEKALAYWDQTMNAGVPIRCEVFVSP